MSAALVWTVHAGVLLPERLLHSPGFEILATFVALNTLMYATLAVLKLVPRGHAVRGWWSRLRDRAAAPEPPRTASPTRRAGARPRGRDRRAEDRSIYAGLPPAVPGAAQPARPRTSDR
ncbi:hypothetical protein [Cellulomonas sp. SG140]|uniref:hypothetical protein n=1 Tax=Cellulomonas sp. SG140 TaxID=2976536 RepID=UPI0021E7E29F|nr:hypothetical protein [Cellulomonas sp. SG140]